VPAEQSCDVVLGLQAGWCFGGVLAKVMHSPGDALAPDENTTHSENSIFGIQSYFRAQTVALDAN
jgi:hypothetical protein